MTNTTTIKGRLGTDVEEKFWSRVDRDGPDGCWTWTGARQSGKWDYGRLTAAGRWTSAHVLSWEITNGPRPKGAVIRHRCDNPPCVNPDHLTVGTFADNTRDMHERGRAGYTGHPGTKNHAAKITPSAVRSLRNDRDQGMSWRKLGEKYGLHKSQARRVALAISWRDVA